MNETTLLSIIAAFVFIAAVALIIQACMLFGIYKTSRAMGDNISRLLPKIEAFVDLSRITVEESRVTIRDVGSTTNEILDTARKQLALVDAILEDAAMRVRVQLDRAEMILDDAMTRTQEAVALLHRGIMKPLREINGLAAGVRAAIQFLLRGTRPNPAQATADEEMFI